MKWFYTRQVPHTFVPANKMSASKGEIKTI